MMMLEAALPKPIRSILEAAIEAVDPNHAVKNALRRDGDRLVVGNMAYNLDEIERVLIIGAGKAAAPMAEAVEFALYDLVKPGRLHGCVVTKYGHGLDPDDRTLIGGVRIEEAAHPVPDAAGVAAGTRLLRLAEAATANDLVVAVISGGGSALLEALPEGVSLEDWQQVTALLLECGASITEVNTLRKRLSLVKGGQLARACHPARVVTLVLSDIVGSPLDAIASGPTVPDSTTWRDAWAVVEKYALAERLPASVLARLEAGLRGELPETPKPGDPVFDGSQVMIVGDNTVATTAAAHSATELGYSVEVRTNALEGEAAEVARHLVQEAVAYQVRAGAESLPALLIWGGETTVTLGSEYGAGGRNQEMALAAALALEGTRGITFVAFATDGTDGPTDCAGGWANGETAARARDMGADLGAALASHAAYDALEKIDALIVTGPTRTNVNDIAFVFIEST